MNIFVFSGFIAMIIVGTLVFALWVDRRFPFTDSCLARIVLFVVGFVAGFLFLWSIQPNSLENILCLGPLVGLVGGGYLGILMPTVVQRTPKKDNET